MVVKGFFFVVRVDYFAGREKGYTAKIRMKKEKISQRATRRTLGKGIKSKNISRWIRVSRTRTSRVSSRFGWDFFRMFDLDLVLGLG